VTAGTRHLQRLAAPSRAAAASFASARDAALQKADRGAAGPDLTLEQNGLRGRAQPQPEAAARGHQARVLPRVLLCFERVTRRHVAGLDAEQCMPACAWPSDARPRGCCRILYVRNLPFNISADEMYDIFGKFGAVRQIRLCAPDACVCSSSC